MALEQALAGGATGNLPTVPSAPQGALEIVEARMLQAKTEAELNRLIDLRGKILAQNELAAKNLHRRRIELIGKISESIGRIICVGIGGTLMYTGNLELGAFFVAAGVYFVAPKFISNAFKKIV